MSKNVGSKDKILRLAIALIIITAYLLNMITGNLAIFLVIIAVALLASVFFSFCPLYKIIGISTCRKKKK